MDLEKFQESMLQSAARHDAEIATIRESLIFHSRFVAVDGEDHGPRGGQPGVRNARVDVKAELAELSRIVFGHVTDRDAHTRS